MSGKIFNASANIYQDQAKVLFDYYKQAAEKIVTDEVKLEKEIEQSRKKVEQLSQEFAKEKQTRLISLIFFFVLVPIYYAIKSHLKMKELHLEIDTNEQKIAEFEKMYK